MIRRDLIIDLLISLYDKRVSKNDFLAELHDAYGMLRAGGYHSASDVERAKILASSEDFIEKKESVKNYLEAALELFDKEFRLRKKK